jgi:hypothetical protein
MDGVKASPAVLSGVGSVGEDNGARTDAGAQGAHYAC